MAGPQNRAAHDANLNPTLLGVSSADGATPVPVEVNPTTGAMLVEGATGGGGGDASASNQTSGAQKTQIVDGVGNVIGATGNALDVNLKTPTTLPVSLASVPSHAVTNAGTFAVQATLTAETTKVIGTVNISASQTIGLAAGTNAIGKLTANSGVTIGAVEIAASQSVALAAGTSLIGRMSSSDETSTVYNGTTALTPKFVAIAASSSGNNTILAAVATKKIRVLALQLVSNGTVNAKWQSGASGTDLTGLAYLIANTGMVLPYSPVGWFETASNTLLNLNLSAAIAVGGSLTYVEV